MYTKTKMCTYHLHTSCIKKTSILYKILINKTLFCRMIRTEISYLFSDVTDTTSTGQ